MPKPIIVIFSGQSRHCDSSSSPMKYLKAASELYATAIKLSPKDAKLHFKLGQILEEIHFVEDCFGFQQEVPVATMLLEIRLNIFYWITMSSTKYLLLSILLKILHNILHNIYSKFYTIFYTIFTQNFTQYFTQFYSDCRLIVRSGSAVLARHSH